MIETTPTLRSFFFDQGSPGDAATPALSEALRAVPAWPGAGRAVAEKLAEALDLSFTDILAGAWNKRRELRQAAEDSLRRPGETVYVPLARHTLTSAHEPSVEVLVNDQPVKRLRFELRLSLEIEGLVLALRDGRIREVAGGTCRAEGTLKLGAATLVQRQSRAFQVLGSVAFGEGIAIVGDGDTSAVAA